LTEINGERKEHVAKKFGVTLFGVLLAASSVSAQEQALLTPIYR
jgi:hypothetical protein